MAKPFSVLPVSFSSMDAYETCPKQFYETRVLKRWKQEESEAMRWGNEVHKALENAIKFGRTLPANMSAYAWGLRAINARSKESVISAELDVAMTEWRRPTGFWDDDAWARGKIDVLIRDEKVTSALNGDWKTGKTKPNSKQLVMSTLLCFAKWPTLEKVRTVFFWLAEQEAIKRMTQQLFIREDDDHVRTTDAKGKIIVTTVADLWEPFNETVEKMKWSMQNNIWPANPSGLCKAYCPVLDCPHNGKRAK